MIGNRHEEITSRYASRSKKKIKVRYVLSIYKHNDLLIDMGSTLGARQSRMRRERGVKFARDVNDRWCCRHRC